MAFYPFPPRQPAIAARLSLTLVSLEDWALVTLAGAESEKYLQSQITTNVSQMTENQHLLSAHCNPKGKMWSSLRLFRYQNGFAMIERRSLRDIQMTELKKYAVFSKVTIIADDNHILLGIAGFQARDALKKLFSALPDADSPLINDGVTYLLWFKYPAERFLIVTNSAIANHITEVLYGKVQLNNSQQWLTLNIEAGEPVIDAINSGQFTPQATNLQKLGGIDFKKGCYVGQEMVARAKFRGANKLALWYLTGYANCVPKAGESLQLKIGKNWRRTGTVLAAAQVEDNLILIQAVMNKDIESGSIFRVHNDDINTLSIKPLPYLLDN